MKKNCLMNENDRLPRIPCAVASADTESELAQVWEKLRYANDHDSALMADGSTLPITCEQDRRLAQEYGMPVIPRGVSSAG